MITDQEINGMAVTLANAKKQYDAASATTKDMNAVMVQAKDAILKAVMSNNNIPAGHFEQIAKKNLVYEVGGERKLVLQGKDAPVEINTYTPEQQSYMKQIDDQIALLTLKKGQVVPVSVEVHNTRSYSVTWSK
jgi:hypothetical protein